MVGDDEELLDLANKLLETYNLSELLELEDISEVQLVYWLLQHGLISTERPCVL